MKYVEFENNSDFHAPNTPDNESNSCLQDVLQAFCHACHTFKMIIWKIGYFLMTVLKSE